MQLRLRPRIRRGFPINRYVIKIVLAIFIVLAIIFFLGKLELPAPAKLIKKEISNEKLIKLK
tara:strand:- start:93 stop:278 length:186 start_codon:yes stop_codon:yes gene_type:complete